MSIFKCGVCSRVIAAEDLHVLVAGAVVCGLCVGSRAAHPVDCPVSWHDGWDHARFVTDRTTAGVLVARGGWRK